LPIELLHNGDGGEKLSVKVSVSAMALVEKAASAENAPTKTDAHVAVNCTSRLLREDSMKPAPQP
jgi:hypothetical protein